MAKTPKAPATRKRRAPAPKAPEPAVEAEPVADEGFIPVRSARPDPRRSHPSTPFVRNRRNG